MTTRHALCSSEKTTPIFEEAEQSLERRESDEGCSEEEPSCQQAKDHVTGQSRVQKFSLRARSVFAGFLGVDLAWTWDRRDGKRNGVISGDSTEPESLMQGRGRCCCEH